MRIWQAGLVTALLAVAGTVHAAELKVQVNADGAGDGLVTNTDGRAQVITEVTKDGTPVGGFAGTNTTGWFAAMIVREPMSLGSNDYLCGGELKPGVESGGRALGVYRVFLGPPTYCTVTPAGITQRRTWKPGNYILSIRGYKRALVTGSTTQYTSDQGSTLVTLTIK